MARLRVMSVSIAYDGQPVSPPPQPKLMQLWYQKMVAGYFARWLPANAPVPGRPSMKLITGVNSEMPCAPFAAAWAVVVVTRRGSCGSAAATALVRTEMSLQAQVAGGSSQM